MLHFDATGAKKANPTIIAHPPSRYSAGPIKTFAYFTYISIIWSELFQEGISFACPFEMSIHKVRGFLTSSGSFWHISNSFSEGNETVQCWEGAGQAPDLPRYYNQARLIFARIKDLEAWGLMSIPVRWQGWAVTTTSRCNGTKEPIVKLAWSDRQQPSTNIIRSSEAQITWHWFVFYRCAYQDSQGTNLHTIKNEIFNLQFANDTNEGGKVIHLPE